MWSRSLTFVIVLWHIGCGVCQQFTFTAPVSSTVWDISENNTVSWDYSGNTDYSDELPVSLWEEDPSTELSSSFYNIILSNSFGSGAFVITPDMWLSALNNSLAEFASAYYWLEVALGSGGVVGSNVVTLVNNTQASIISAEATASPTTAASGLVTDVGPPVSASLPSSSSPTASTLISTTSLIASSSTSSSSTTPESLIPSRVSTVTAPQASKSAQNSPGSSPTLSKGEISGIAVASVFVALLLFSFCFWLMRRRRRKDINSARSMPEVERHDSSSWRKSELEGDSPEMASNSFRDSQSPGLGIDFHHTSENDGAASETIAAHSDGPIASSPVELPNVPPAHELN